MKRDLLVKQHDLKDCGAACIASLAAHYGFKLSIARIRQLAHTDARGTNALGLVTGLGKLGFNSRGVRGDLDALTGIPLPAIAHVVVKQQLQHYVVVYRVDRKNVHLMDPAYGSMIKMKIEEFVKVWSGVLILAEPNEYFERRYEKSSVFSRFWFIVKPHRKTLFCALSGAIVYTILGLSMSIYLQKVTDYVLVDNNARLLNLMSVVMIVILLFQMVIGSIKSIMVLQTGQRMDRSLILGYYKHLLTLPQYFFDTMKVGEIVSRINEAVKIRAFINDVSVSILVNIFIVIFSFTLMFTYYWKLAAIVALVIPIYSLLYWLSNKLNKKVERDLMEKGADLESHLVESLNAMRTIKQFGVEDFANNISEVKFSRLLKSVYKSVLNMIFSATSTNIISHIFIVFVIWLGAYYVMKRIITPGELLSFYALIGYFTGPVSELIGANKSIQNALIAADRLFEIMDLESEDILDKMQLFSQDVGDIVFQNISFRYGTRVQVFENFSCTFQKGKTTAIIGESGSGKTTISSLIQNLYPLTDGKILIGGYDINHIASASLRKIISVVPQQIDLFSGSLIDNIALGEDSPDIQRVIDISNRLGISGFIEKLPGGFRAYLGENGTLLSVGEKQRIAIARALYRQPEILILDEATSSLDTESEQVVQKVIEGFRSMQKTVIVIAHRLSTVVKSDRILVLRNGRVTEEGTHNDLMAADSYYKSLWLKQNRAL